MADCIDHTYEWISVDSRGGTSGKRYKTEANAKQHGGSDIVRRLTLHHMENGSIWEGTEDGHPHEYVPISREAADALMKAADALMKGITDPDFVIEEVGSIKNGYKDVWNPGIGVG